MCFSATISASHVLTLQTYISYYIKWGGVINSVTKLGILLDFRQPFKAFGNN